MFSYGHLEEIHVINSPVKANEKKSKQSCWNWMNRGIIGRCYELSYIQDWFNLSSETVNSSSKYRKSLHAINLTHFLSSVPVMSFSSLIPYFGVRVGYASSLTCRAIKKKLPIFMQCPIIPDFINTTTYLFCAILTYSDKNHSIICFLESMCSWIK